MSRKHTVTLLAAVAMTLACQTTPAVAHDSETLDAAACNQTHVVRRGDTLYRLGVRYGMPWREIQQANGMRGTVLRVGRTLCIPVAEVAKPEILSFTVSNPRPKQGETVVFSWQSRGLQTVGLTHQNPYGYLTNRGISNLPPSGSVSFAFAGDDEHNHRFTITGGPGGRVQKTINVTVQCLRPIFFSSRDALFCPTEAAVAKQAVFQAFERGFMVWMVWATDDGPRSQIYIFSANGTGSIVDDSFAQGEPELDPAIVAPPGKFQPVRGFGKAWRAGYRDQLGWALSPEAGYAMTFQASSNPPQTTYSYQTLPSGEVLSLRFERLGLGRVFSWSRVQTAK